MRKNIYGWIPSIPDHRDLKFTPIFTIPPTSIDWRNKCPEVYDQGQLGSCTANAIGGDCEMNQIRQGLPHWTPSRLEIYYNERKMEGTIKSDSGAQIRDGIKVVASQGVCPETDWPYDITKFAKKPPTKSYKEALQNTVDKYQSVSLDLAHVKACLFQLGPFVFGFTVYESFESDEVAKTGIIPIPGKTEQCLGGHAVMAVGYDDSKSCVIVRNSWGATWGDKGYCYMPYGYITNSDLASDAWVIQHIR